MARQRTAPTAAGPPLARLYEQAGLPAWGLPQELAAVYGGDLGFTEPCVYANFVASVDGVTALGPEYPSSGSVISGHDPAGRFLMGLLRACADIVLIGAGTLRATPGHRWTPRHIYPAAADGYAALRRSLRCATAPSSSPREPGLGGCEGGYHAGARSSTWESTRRYGPWTCSPPSKRMGVPRCSPRAARGCSADSSPMTCSMSSSSPFPPCWPAGRRPPVPG